MFIERCSIVKAASLRDGRPMKLGRDEIVEAALGLVDERGLDALNMRALA